jgi:hypothetical protein
VFQRQKRCPLCRQSKKWISRISSFLSQRPSFSSNLEFRFKVAYKNTYAFTIALPGNYILTLCGQIADLYNWPQKDASYDVRVLVEPNISVDWNGEVVNFTNYCQVYHFWSHFFANFNKMFSHFCPFLQIVVTY